MAISTYKIFLMQKVDEAWQKLIDIKFIGENVGIEFQSAFPSKKCPLESCEFSCHRDVRVS